MSKIHTNTKEVKANYHLDQSSAPNHVTYSTNWMNYKGAWLATVCIVIGIKMLYSLIPFLSSEATWALTNLTFNAGHFVMFHWLQGTPNDTSQGVYDGLTVWEQLDDGVQFTATRKFLVALPILLFLLSSYHTYEHYLLFTIDLFSLFIVLIAKLPIMHQVRVFGINKRGQD